MKSLKGTVVNRALPVLHVGGLEITLTAPLREFICYRPGPYICGEWEFGGMPSWLLHQHPMFFRYFKILTHFSF